MEYSKEDLMEAKKQILGVGENMGTEESKKIWEENAQFWDNAMGDESNEFHREVVRPKVTELLSPNPADYILDIACGNGNYSSYLQVLAYMFRFDAKAGYYLYPEAAGTADRRLWMNKGSTYEANVAPRDDICLTKHGLKIPVDAENYEMFVFQMKVSEAEFRQVFAAR